MKNENIIKLLNEEIKDILKNFPPDKMWLNGDLIIELQNALKGKDEYRKNNIVNKYNKIICNK